MRVFLSIVAVCALLVSPAFAEGHIGVVDVTVLLSESKASKNIQSQIDTYRSKNVSVLSKAEKALVEEERKLAGARASLDPAEFEKRVRAFDKDRVAFQKKAVAYRSSINATSVQAEKSLMNEIVKVVGDIAAEKSYELVITKQNVIVGSTSLDITNEALKRLNKATSKIKVKFE